MLSAGLVVTTSLAEDARLVERAREVAARCRAPFRPRSVGLARWLEDPDVELVYVVSAEKEELCSVEARLSVHEGLLKLRTRAGLEHPLIRAVAPEGAPPVREVVDATVGLAQDSLHIAASLEAEVLGLEASPVIASLTEAGLSRIARGPRWADAASRIQLRIVDARSALSKMAPGSADVVYLDPMFDVPARAQPGYALLRRCAQPAPLDRALLEAASRVAKARVVVKVPFGRTLPEIEAPAPAFNRRVCGKAVDYLVVEKALSAPSWERPRRPRPRKDVGER